MDKYLLPIKVNDRKSCHLCLGTERCNCYDFVCSSAGMARVPLFSYPQNWLAASSQCMANDHHIAFDYLSPSKEEQDNCHRYEMCFTPNPGDENVPLTFPNEERFLSLSVDEPNDANNAQAEQPDNYVHILASCEMQAAEVEIDIVINQIDDKPYKCKLRFHIFPGHRIYRTVIDFGSEASQMLISTGWRHSMVNILNVAKKQVYPEMEGIENALFHQAPSDPRDPSTLFNSVFYIPGMDSPAEKIPLFLSHARQNLQLKEQKYELLPNLKIGQLRGVDVDLSYYYLHILKDFVRTACFSIIGRQPSSDITETLGMQLILLVPNVMVMEQISDLVRSFQYMINNLPEEPELARFRFEVTAVSESDASFLGYVNRWRASKECPIEVPNTCLIVDGGKGTLDSSVVVLKNLNEYKSVFRDGFVGAGNALSFAEFDNICTIITGLSNLDDRKNLAHKLLFGEATDKYTLRTLVEVIERIKKSDKYDGTHTKRIENLKKQFRTSWNKGEGLNLSALVNYLEKEGNTGSYGDPFSIISGTCQMICRKMVESLLSNGIISESMPKTINGEPYTEPKLILAKFTKVILSGRAFLHTLFRKEFCRCMEEYFGIREEDIIFNPDDAKTGCMAGVLDQRSLMNCNSGVGGIPNKRRVFSQRVVQQQKKGGYEVSDVEMGMLKFMHRLQGNKNSTQPLTLVDSNYEVDEHFLNHGKNIKIEPDQGLYLNGQSLDCPTQGKCNLYYNGRNLVVRKNNNVFHLSHNQILALADGGLLIPTLFPVYSEEDKKMFNLFKIANNRYDDTNDD